MARRHFVVLLAVLLAHLMAHGGARAVRKTASRCRAHSFSVGKKTAYLQILNGENAYLHVPHEGESNHLLQRLAEDESGCLLVGPER